MQDRRRQFDEIFLQRTAGPYIGSTDLAARLNYVRLSFNSRYRKHTSEVMERGISHGCERSEMAFRRILESASTE